MFWCDDSMPQVGKFEFADSIFNVRFHIAVLTYLAAVNQQ